MMFSCWSWAGSLFYILGSWLVRMDDLFCCMVYTMFGDQYAEVDAIVLMQLQEDIRRRVVRNKDVATRPIEVIAMTME